MRATLFTVYDFISLKQYPNVSLAPMGPFLDLSVRRTQRASEDLWKAAIKKAPVSSEPKKIKNISRDSMGDKFGRIHLVPQDLDRMGGRRGKALRSVKKGTKRLSGEAQSETQTSLSGKKRLASSEEYADANAGTAKTRKVKFSV